MQHAKPAGQLRPGEVVVLCQEDGDLPGWAANNNEPLTARRVAATVVDVVELEGTATEPSVSTEENRTMIVLGTPNDVQVRIAHDGRTLRFEVNGGLQVEVLEPHHHPVCATCAEVWPCREHRHEVEAARFAGLLEDL